MNRSEAVAEFAAALELGLPNRAVQIAGCYLAVAVNSGAAPFFMRELENHPKFRGHELEQALLCEFEGARRSGDVAGL